MNSRLQFECDVLVIGGSLEGCIAALEWAKKGKKVLLTERHGSLGGMSTNGLNTYIPPYKLDNTKAKSYANILLENSKDGEDDDCTLFHDQKLKLVLERMLHDAGVTVLKHLYLDKLYQYSSYLYCSFCTKTDFLDVVAQTVLDATDTMTAAADMGWLWSPGRDVIEVHVKWNGILSTQLKKISTHIIEETTDTLVGIASIPFNGRKNNQLFFTSEINYYHNKRYEETIFSGFCAEISNVNDFIISNSISGLRIFVYAFRDYFTRTYSGMEKADIIHVASMVDCYGLRLFEINPNSNLILLNNIPNRYNNWDAIMSGIENAHLIISPRLR